jgi:hypothetical protein
VRISTVLAIMLTAILAGIVALANRAPVTLSFDPLPGGDSGYALTMPLFLLIFLVFLLGVAIGGLAVRGRRPRTPSARPLNTLERP